MEPAADITGDSPSPGKAQRPARGHIRRSKSLPEMSVRLTRALAEGITRLKLSNDRFIPLLGESLGRKGSTRAKIDAIRG